MKRGLESILSLIPVSILGTFMSISPFSSLKAQNQQTNIMAKPFNEPQIFLERADSIYGLTHILNRDKPSLEIDSVVNHEFNKPTFNYWDNVLRIPYHPTNSETCNNIWVRAGVPLDIKRLDIRIGIGSEIGKFSENTEWYIGAVDPVVTLYASGKMEVYVQRDWGWVYTPSSKSLGKINFKDGSSNTEELEKDAAEQLMKSTSGVMELPKAAISKVFVFLNKFTGGIKLENIGLQYAKKFPEPSNTEQLSVPIYRPMTGNRNVIYREIGVAWKDYYNTDLVPYMVLFDVHLMKRMGDPLYDEYPFIMRFEIYLAQNE